MLYDCFATVSGVENEEGRSSSRIERRDDEENFEVPKTPRSDSREGLADVTNGRIATPIRNDEVVTGNVRPQTPNVSVRT